MARRIIDRFDEQPISQALSRKKDFIAALVGLFVAIGGSAYGAPRSSGLWWMPDVATKSGAQIDQLTYFIYYLTGAVFILTQVVYIYFLIRYRARRGVRVIYSHGDNRLEVVWTAIPTAIFIGLLVLDESAFSASSPWLRGLRPRLERRRLARRSRCSRSDWGGFDLAR
jgi:hypothetical protein